MCVKGASAVNIEIDMVLNFIEEALPTTDTAAAKIGAIPSAPTDELVASAASLGAEQREEVRRRSTQRASEIL